MKRVVIRSKISTTTTTSVVPLSIYFYIQRACERLWYLNTWTGGIVPRWFQLNIATKTHTFLSYSCVVWCKLCWIQNAFYPGVYCVVFYLFIYLSFFRNVGDCSDIHCIYDHILTTIVLIVVRNVENDHTSNKYRIDIETPKTIIHI